MRRGREKSLNRSSSSFPPMSPSAQFRLALPNPASLRRPASPPTPTAPPAPGPNRPPPRPNSARARPPAVKMPPRRAMPRSSTGYHDMRLRPSGRWAAEIMRGGERFWLGTFESAELAAGAYDVMVWRFDGVAGPRNFFDVDNLAAAEFVAPAFNVITRTEERAVRRKYMWMSIRNRDEVDMAAFRAAHPQHVEAELEFYAQLTAQRAAAAAACPSSSSVPPPTIVVDDDPDWIDNMVVELEAEEAAKKTVEDDDNPDWCNKMVVKLEAKEAAEEAAKKAAEDGDNSNFDEDFWDKP
nr:ethylene-responsive transcription factor ERF110-like [Lolium perenne]